MEQDMLAEKLEQEYQLKNLLLAYPNDWFVDKETLDKAKLSIPSLLKFYNSIGAEDPQPSPIQNIIKETVKDVYTVPLFSETFCKLLIDEMKNLESFYGFKPNPDDDELRQIPEIVLQECCLDIYNSLFQIIYSVVNPILLSIWNRHVTGGGIQIANYNLKDKKQGAWHHDADADISIVVPLNTGEYKGGGTEFLNRGIVKPIPTGNALIFPSFTHMHRGLPIESGDRYLLVFWLTCKEQKDEI
jgi:hypothetical protein